MAGADLGSADLGSADPGSADPGSVFDRLTPAGAERLAAEVDRLRVHIAVPRGG